MLYKYASVFSGFLPLLLELFNTGSIAEEKLYVFLRTLSRDNYPMDFANGFCNKGLDEENTVGLDTILIPDEISSQSNLNDYRSMAKYYKISETREIQDSPTPYALSIQKPPAAKLKPDLWSLHVLPIHNTLVLIIDLGERHK